MKTTEKISLGGYAFVIESEAYVELESYLSEIRECFRNDNSADEIIDDIEVRIAELLKEKYADSTVVNMRMIASIKERIGDPKEVAGQEEEEDVVKETSKCPLRDKRLYRDIDDRALAGVCSGLGLYFNIDKVVFRLFFLIAFCLGFFDAEDGLFTLAILAYIILWIAMPAARTVEEKCEMYRKPIDLKDYRDNENRFTREIKEAAGSPALHTAFRILGIAAGIIFIIMGLGGFSATIFFPSLPEIIGSHVEFDPLIPEDIIGSRIVLDPVFWWLMFGVVGFASLGLLYTGVVLCFNLKTPSWRPGLIIFILWVVSILVTIAWVLKKVAEFLPTII